MVVRMAEMIDQDVDEGPTVSPFSDEEVSRHISLGEDSGWEFIEIAFSGNRIAVRQHNTWADKFVAFANTDGGVLLLGVSDEGVVTGITRGQLDEVELVARQISGDANKPPVRVRTYRRLHHDRSFLVVLVPRGDTQHEGPGGAYQRVGAAKVRMSPDERMQ